jgi:hypothetical protein
MYFTSTYMRIMLLLRTDRVAVLLVGWIRHRTRVLLKLVCSKSKWQIRALPLQILSSICDFYVYITLQSRTMTNFFMFCLYFLLSSLLDEYCIIMIDDVHYKLQIFKYLQLFKQCSSFGFGFALVRFDWLLLLFTLFVFWRRLGFRWLLFLQLLQLFFD